MAAFQKIFYAIDKDNTGVITSTDLRNHMQKMKYKENFVTTWTSLFDPEHTGIITYEKYCEVLGLKPEQRPPSPLETDSNSHPIESQTKLTNPESVKTEPIKQKPERQNSGSSDSKRQKHIDSMSKEDSNSSDSKAQKPSHKGNTKSFNAKKANLPEEGTGKQSRKRKYTESPRKEDLVTPVPSKSNVESLSPENSGKEIKSELVDSTVDLQAMEPITPQKVEQTSSEKPSEKLKVEKSGKKSKNRERNRSHKASGNSPKESPKEESKPQDNTEGDSSTDIFDFLMTTKSNPIQTIDDSSDEKSAKSKDNEITPETAEPTSAFKSDSPSNVKTEKSPKEKSDETEKERKQEQSEKIGKELSDKNTEQPEDKGMDTFDFPMATKDSPIETKNDFHDQPTDTIVSKTAELTLSSNSNSPQESKKDKPDQKSKNRSRKASEKSEKKSQNVNSDIPTSSQELQGSGADIFDWLIETKDHPMETIDDDIERNLTVNSDKSSESKSRSPRHTENKGSRQASEESKTADSEIEHPGDRDRNISESGEQSTKPSESTFGHESQPANISEDSSKGPKHVRRASKSSNSDETKKHSPEGIHLEESRKKEKKGKREKKVSESSKHLSEEKIDPESLGHLESTKKSGQEGKKRDKKTSGSLSESPNESTAQREKKPSEPSKVEMEIEPTLTPGSLESVPLTIVNENAPSSENKSKKSSESSVAHQEPKKPPKNKRQKKPPESKSDEPLEPVDVEMTAVQEVVVPAAETSVRSENLQLSKRPAMEITPTPMEIEIIPCLMEMQESTELTETVVEQKEDKQELPEIGNKRCKKGTESSTKGHEEPLTEKTYHEQQQPSKDGKKSADKKSRRNKKSSPVDKEPMPLDDIEIIPSISEPQQSSMPFGEIGIIPTKEHVVESPVPSIEQKDSKEMQGQKLSESSVSETAESINPIAASAQEISKSSKQKQEEKASESALNEGEEIKSIKKEAIDSTVEQETNKKAPRPKKSPETSSVKGETHDVPKSSDEHKEDKKNKRPKKNSESAKEGGKKSPTEQKPVEESITPSVSTVQESKVLESKREKATKENQDESKGFKKQTLQKSEDTAKPMEFEPESAERQESGKKFPRFKKPFESSSVKTKADDVPKLSEEAKDNKKGKQSEKPSEFTNESENKSTIEQKPAEESIKQTKSVPQESAKFKIQKESSKKSSTGKQDQPKGSKKDAPQNSEEESKATTSKMDTTPSGSVPDKQSKAAKIENKQNKKGEQKQVRHLENTLKKKRTPPTRKSKDGGSEITNQPPKESESSKKRDSADSK
ncbi:unnamed protein product [Hymenolepis diminuta]|nr:unnamed protein product [Hymenolepis diminuta]